MLFALPVARLFGIALVVQLLAPGQRKLDLRPAAPVEIDRERDQRHALAADSNAHLVDLALMKQQLAGPLGLVIMAIAMAEFRDVRVDQPDLIILHLGIAFGDGSLAEAQRLHLGAGERNPRLEKILEEIFIARAPVLRDRLHFLEGFGARTSH
jgi:hypothetical protein